MDFNKEIFLSHPDPSSWPAVYVVFWFLYILPITSGLFYWYWGSCYDYSMKYNEMQYDNIYFKNLGQKHTQTLSQ